MKNLKLYRYLLIIMGITLATQGTQLYCAAGAGAGMGAGAPVLPRISPEKAYELGKIEGLKHWKREGELLQALDTTTPNPIPKWESIRELLSKKYSGVSNEDIREFFQGFTNLEIISEGKWGWQKKLK